LLLLIIKKKNDIDKSEDFLKKKDVNIQVKHPMTLAEIYHSDEESQIIPEPEKAMGFAK